MAITGLLYESLIQFKCTLSSLMDGDTHTLTLLDIGNQRMLLLTVATYIVLDGCGQPSLSIIWLVYRNAEECARLIMDFSLRSIVMQGKE